MKSMSADENANENKGKNESAHARIYELCYLLNPAIKEEDITVHYGNIKEMVTSLGGEIIADEVPKLIPLAYTMEKVVANVKYNHNSAYFGWVKFYMDNAKVSEMKVKLDLDSNFVRYLLIKTVKENTIASKRFIREDRGLRRPLVKKEKEEGPAPEINKEEIDKEIEAMVAAQ